MTAKKSNTVKVKRSNTLRNDAFLLKVGNRIQQIMNEKEITHEIFYHDTSINPHRLIIGKVNMTLSTFERICSYLEISPADFFKDIK
jgi:DNA-binding Xre family transcriptional regulator